MKSFNLLLISFITLSIFYSCESEASKTKRFAEEAARLRAAEFVAAQPMNEMQLQDNLFSIKANETRLREAGFNEAADAYIYSFRKEVEALSDSLATIVFGVKDDSEN